MVKKAEIELYKEIHCKYSFCLRLLITSSQSSKKFKKPSKYYNSTCRHLILILGIGAEALKLRMNTKCGGGEDTAVFGRIGQDASANDIAR